MRFYALILLLLVTACARENDRLVTYRITDSVSGFSVRYLNEAGEIVADQVTVQSAEDVWSYEYVAGDGDIVFVSSNYKDPLSAIKVQVMIDGKVYKQASSKNDTTSFITVSGVIPIRE